jgi:hypothetical protein
VSIDPPDPPMGYDFCGDSTSVAAFTGENVRWCYEITNNTAGNLTRHDLTSSEFGSILSNFPFTLVPGASAFLTRVEPVMVSRTETATWTAYNPGPVDQQASSDSASVTASSGITLEVTASIDPLVLPPNYDFCGTESVVASTPGRDVRWCYRVTNVSSISRTRHSLDSDRLGLILSDFPFTLVSGASAFLTQVETLGEATLTERATWTAYQPGPTHESVAVDQARALVDLAIFGNGFE